MSEHNRTDLAGETPSTIHPGNFVVVEVNVFSISFLWEAIFNRNLLAVPMASTRYQQSLEIG
jgi:hypothetical protein